MNQQIQCTCMAILALLFMASSMVQSAPHGMKQREQAYRVRDVRSIESLRRSLQSLLMDDDFSKRTHQNELLQELLHDARTFSQTGTVKWYNEPKGFGFIDQDGGGEDVFFDYSAFPIRDGQAIREGQKVQFYAEKGPRGPVATEVIAV